MLLEPELHLQGDRVVLSHMYLNFYFETKFNEYINYIYSESAFKSLQNKSISKEK